MSNSFNTTGNKFYETVTLHRGRSSAKGFLLPAKNGKADLGSSRKKFDKVYANDFISAGKSSSQGTWTPGFNFYTISSNNRINRVRGSNAPNITNIDSNYTISGGLAVVTSYFSAQLQPTNKIRTYFNIKDLPYRKLQRTFKTLSSLSSPLAGSTKSNYYQYITSEPFVDSQIEMNKVKFMIGSATTIFTTVDSASRSYYFAYVEERPGYSRYYYYFSMLYPVGL